MTWLLTVYSSTSKILAAVDHIIEVIIRCCVRLGSSGTVAAAAETFRVKIESQAFLFMTLAGHTRVAYADTQDATSLVRS